MKWVEWPGVLTHAVTCLSLSEWKKKRPQNSGFTLYFSTFDSICITPEQWQREICFLGKHYVCPGAQRIGKEVRKEGQWRFPRSFGPTSLKWGKNLLAWSDSLQLLPLGKWGGKSKICGEKKQLFLGLLSLTIFLGFFFFWLRLKAYLGLWTEEKNQDTKGTVKYFP